MRVVLVTDIPTPYRNHAFERMAEVFPEYGIDFEVYFMAWTEPRRTWKFSHADLKFPHRVFRGLHPTVRGAAIHFNPGMLGRLAVERADVLIVGGYYAPSHFLAPFVANPSGVRVLWAEGNAHSIRQTSGPIYWAKRAIVSRYDAYMVPGERSSEMLRSLSSNAGVSPNLVFPNIIDRAVFRARVVELRTAARAEIRREIGVSVTEQLWVIPARLSPEKGLAEFMDAIPEGLTARIIVAGDGPLRSQLEANINERALPVTLAGNLAQEELVRLYAAADLMVLPSIWDSSPLTVVEAIAARLPLFVSNRVGNFSDVLASGVNGFTYDPATPEANRAQMRVIASLPAASLAAMGELSGARYDVTFDSELCIRRLAEQLVFLAQNRSPTSAT